MQKSKKFIIEDKQGNNMYPASFTDIVFRADGIKLEDELDRIDSKDVEQDNKLSQHERRLTEVEGKGGSSNVLLGEEEQDKFNFVKNEVVQDGLIKSFSVLNNTDSIKSLEVTKGDTTTSYNFATTENHVEMSTGRTLREEYMGVLKTMGKEFTSTDGSPITVDNGVEARIINAEIKGQTLKNILPTEIIQTLQGDGVSWKPNRILLTSVPQLKPNTQYTYAIEVYENTLTKDAIGGTYGSPYAFTSDVVIPKGKIGIITGLTTTISDLSQSNNGVAVQTTLYNTETGSVKFRRMLFEGDVRNQVTSYIPFGLSSTEAIISNNGQQYPIYASEEDKANKKVISLGGVGDVADALEIKEDGSGVYIKNSVDYYLKNTDGWKVVNTGTPNYYFQVQVANPLKPNKVVSDKFNFGIIGNTTTNIGIDTVEGGYIRIRPSTTEPTLESFKTSIADGINVKCVLATPTVTTIDKSIIPTIATANKTNILHVGGAVKPSSFKVTVPVDRLAEIEARLQTLESTTVDVVLNK